jgi:hypothetical protein
MTRQEAIDSIINNWIYAESESCVGIIESNQSTIEMVESLRVLGVSEMGGYAEIALSYKNNPNLISYVRDKV